MRIDWLTLALQTVNVIILIWLLGRFFFRPVMDIVVKRRDEAKKLLADAERARQEAADSRADADRTRTKIAAERQILIAQAQDAVQVEKQKLLAQSSDEVAKRRAAAEAAIARDRVAAETAIIEHASDLAVDIAHRVLNGVPQQQLLSAFVEQICRELRALSPEALQGFAATGSPVHPIEVITAAPLSVAEITQVRTALNQAFGVEVPLAFRSDPAIIGGIELKSETAIIRNSWNANLGRIRQELLSGPPSRRA